MNVNVHEAKTRLSELLRRVEAGETVVIARSGTPVARLVPAQPVQPRRPGAWRGRVRLAPDFDTTPQELLDAMETPLPTTDR